MASSPLQRRIWHEIAAWTYKLFRIYKNLKSPNRYVCDCYISRRYSNCTERILSGYKCRYLEWCSVGEFNVKNRRSVLICYICLWIGIIIHKCKFCLYESIGSIARIGFQLFLSISQINYFTRHRGIANKDYWRQFWADSGPQHIQFWRPFFDGLIRVGLHKPSFIQNCSNSSGKALNFGARAVSHPDSYRQFQIIFG